jgi:hypothetical protein
MARCSGDLLTPSPPAEKSTNRFDSSGFGQKAVSELRRVGRERPGRADNGRAPDPDAGALRRRSLLLGVPVLRRRLLCPND